jgi:crotonobetainyl-CoA:carnitine CoA-transferase CaiB-like acyl-CoA transferase
MHTPPLQSIFVVDLSEGIGGAYATKILVDGGADVVKVELATGDPLRQRSVTGAVIDEGESGALFKHLSASKHSVVVDPGEPDQPLLDALLSRADAIIWNEGSLVAETFGLSPTELRRRAPQAIIGALSPFGLSGPWAGKPATPATIESWAGGPAWRGTPDRPPVIQGGEPSEWVGGTYVALGILIGLYRRRVGGLGELVDVSMLEALSLTQVMHARTFLDIAGAPWRAERQITVPEIHPTQDGFVGFMVVTGQQWLDFCVLIEQPTWAEDESLFNMANRSRRRHELVSAIDDWTSRHTTDEATELAALLRIPATPVANGATAPLLDQFVERGFFVENEVEGFVQPQVPYVMHGADGPRPFGPSPALGEHTEEYRARALDANFGVNELQIAADAPDPFASIRVADFTQFWAGNSIAHPLAMFGADVVHVESIAHPDGARYSNVRLPGQPDWWEYGPFFQAMATNKRDVTIDLDATSGQELAIELLRQCDVMVENYTPRVCENWGLTYDVVSKARPDIIMVRAPAFGLTGPWRDRGGYAPIMEQASGLGYITGYPDENPLSPFGPGDPVAGAHAAVGIMLALFDRRRTGRGMLLEVPMAGSAVNIAAEAVVEYSAYGNLLERSGNRSAFAAPQGMYLTADQLDDGRLDRWVMISIATDEQWAALVGVLDDEHLAADRFRNHAGRLAAHSELDDAIAAWCAQRTRNEIVAALWGADIPVAEATLGHELDQLEQHRSRNYFHPIPHPMHGEIVQMDFPLRMSAGPNPLVTTRAPLLGEHNVEVLQGLLGVSNEELAELERTRVVGTAAVQPDQTWSV